MTRYGLWVYPLLLITGCSNRSVHPLDEAAPKWGSTPRLSTAAGFIEGRWLLKREAKPDAPFIITAGIEATQKDPTILSFTKDGQFKLEQRGHSVHGVWSSTNDRIVLSPRDIDGKTKATFDTDLEKWSASNPYKGMNRYHIGGKGRSFIPKDPSYYDPRQPWNQPYLLQANLWNLCEVESQLVVSQDGRRLVVPSLPEEQQHIKVPFEESWVRLR